jgi:drug/metabolite transporter (DMT)-like permease
MIERLGTRFAALPPAGRGALWMVFAAFGFASSSGMIRHLSGQLHVFEIAFFRTLFGLLYMLPWVLRYGASVLYTERIGLHGLRAIFGVVAMISWFTALSRLALADAMALSFTTPIFTTILAGVFLGEIVRMQRWLAVAIGFVGTLIIVRPGATAFDPWNLIALLSSACFASAAIAVKRLARTEHPNAIMTYMALFIAPLAAIPAAFVWQWPSLDQLVWLAAIGAGTTVGHMGLTRAYAIADATAVQPLLYVQLPLVATIGYVAFEQKPTVYTWIGAAIIVCACLFIAHREIRGGQPEEPTTPVA